VSKVYTRELARRYPTILSVAIHPGTVPTSLVSNLPLGHRIFINTGAMLTGGYLIPEQGAYSPLWGATADVAAVKSGELYEPVGVLTKQLDKDCKSDDLPARLWTWTEEQLKDF
jgi:hypothetical protein